MIMINNKFDQLIDIIINGWNQWQLTSKLSTFDAKNILKKINEIKSSKTHYKILCMFVCVCMCLYIYSW